MIKENGDILRVPNELEMLFRICQHFYIETQWTTQLETAAFPPLRNNAARRAIQSNRLLPAAVESISHRQGVTGRSSMTTAAEPLYMHHYVITWRHPQNRKYVTYCTIVIGGPSHGQT